MRKMVILLLVALLHRLDWALVASYFDSLAVRQQLAVLNRKTPRPRLEPSDRWFWVLISSFWPDWRDALAIVKPATVIGWHRKGSLGTPLAFAAKRLGDGQLLIVANNGPADKALKAYRKRWQIECLFGDSKIRGLNMEDTRLTQPAKLNTLLVIITLAMAWAYACATAIKGTRAIKTRAHGYRYKSWFRLGFDQLRKWILHDPDRAADIWRQIWPKRNNAFLNHRVV